MPKDKIKVAYVISNIDRWIAFEWIEEYFRDSNIQIDFYLLSGEKGYFYQYLKQKNQNVHWHLLTGKNHYFSIILWLMKIFTSNKYSAVHCHFLDASICGLIAAKLSGINKRIYTRHHSTFHHEFAKKGVYYDKLCNKLSTIIIAISKNVQEILVNKEFVDPGKVSLIYHGFRWKAIMDVPDVDIEQIAKKYRLLGKHVVGVISRFIEWKGVQYIIPAFAQYLKKHPESVLVLANARGDYYEKITDLLEEIPNKSYRLIPFENDIYALFKNFNVFIHAPVDEHIEAFGQIYVESMALGIPAIYTKSGIGSEILQHKYNSLVVPFKDSQKILSSLLLLQNEPSLAKKIGKRAQETVNPAFSIQAMIKKLQQVYKTEE